MGSSTDVTIARLTRYLFTAPSWPRSLFIIVLLGLIVDGASIQLGAHGKFLGTLAFTLPALVATLLTKPLINRLGKPMTWNRSALLAMACTVFCVIITLCSALASFTLVPLLFACSLGFIFGIRLLVLVAIADYRVPRMVVPALIQPAVGVIVGTLWFLQPFFLLSLILILVFGLGFVALIWLIERPLYKAFHIKGLNFINAFIAHNTDGSRSMEDFFREIGEEVYVPQVSLFFKRNEKNGVIMTIPNVHPGPMGEIGGGNLPKVMTRSFTETVLVPHGCATHDFNLVSESEVSKLVAAVKGTRAGLEYEGRASLAYRVTYGSVDLLYQRFGETILMVSTRSPEKTEDLDFPLGLAIMAEGRRVYKHVAFIDGHNCMTEITSPVMAGTLTATEYLRAVRTAVDAAAKVPQRMVKVGVAEVTLPFTRDQGFGDLGVQVLVVEVDWQKTAYVLLDGNNIEAGVREVIRDAVLEMVDEAEVMTTDSHVVNTITGKNPIGLKVPAAEILPFVLRGVEEAIADLSTAEVAASTACCEKVVVFGSNRIAQLACTVNAMLIYIAPLSFAILLLAFLLSIFAYRALL
ncbi:DUF2070 family protein [Methanosphaerula subterraneus]|uniref:DUF2070 family protein n=1 Tax=Methanosphaerula subterraneus TaxID=3350244 RepID=UPI003F85FEB4